MKIPGKQPIKTIINKLPQLNSEQQKAISDVVNNGVSNNIVSLDTKEILYKKSNKTFSVKFLNYVEPYLIKGQRYTLFYTDIDHNLRIGDRIFLVGGNYDSDILIQNNKFSKLSDGYTVQYVDKTKVVLDIEYTGVLPWIEENIDSFIKVYVASNQEEFDYSVDCACALDTICEHHVGCRHYPFCGVWPWRCAARSGKENREGSHNGGRIRLKVPHKKRG
jgi:hypothetical protein